MCRIARLFLLQRLKGSMSGNARDFNNIETRSRTYSCDFGVTWNWNNHTFHTVFNMCLFTNLTLIGFSYGVNYHHVATVVLTRIDRVPLTWSVKCQNTQHKQYIESVSSNVIHHSQNCIEYETTCAPLQPQPQTERLSTSLKATQYGSQHPTGSIAMRRLTTGIRSEKCVVRRFRRCANVIQCTYTNLDSTV